MTTGLKTILITGATGTLGSVLRRHLEANGRCDVRPLSKFQDGDASVFAADLTTYDPSWADHFKGVDTVVHLAGDGNPLGSWDTMIPMNVDMALNVFRAAIASGVGRIVFASSNWVMAGYRFTDDVLTTDLTPCPINPYGATKAFAERYGKHLCEHHDISFIGLRIGSCKSVADRHMTYGAWEQAMWLSPRDWCQAVEKAIDATDVKFAIVNLMSANAGMRWDLSETRRVLGYEPQDGHTPIRTPAFRMRNLTRKLQARLFGPSSRNVITEKW